MKVWYKITFKGGGWSKWESIKDFVEYGERQKKWYAENGVLYSKPEILKVIKVTEEEIACPQLTT